MGIPLYRRIADQLRRDIAAGVYQPGDALPQQAELATKFNTTRGVVQVAITTLAQEGLITSARHRGAVVQHPPMPLRLTRYAESLNTSGRSGPWEIATAGSDPPGHMVVLSVTTQPATMEVAQALNLPPYTHVVHRHRHAMIGDAVIQIQHSWIPASIAGGTRFTEPEVIQGGTYALLLTLGHRPTHVTETITGRASTRDEVTVFRRGRHSPVLIITRVTYDHTGAPLEYLHITAVADRTVLEYAELPVHPDRTTDGAVQ
jgi:GntR family transcriptional regulator